MVYVFQFVFFEIDGAKVNSLCKSYQVLRNRIVLVYQNLLKILIISTITSTIGIGVLSDLNAQNNPKIDSISSLLRSSDQASRCSLLIDLSLEYVKLDMNRALSIIGDAYNCASEIGDSIMLVKSGRIKGQILRRLDNIPEAIKIFTAILPIAKHNNLKSDYKLILNSLAIAYTFQGNFDIALRYHFESLVLREEDGDKEGLSVTLNNIGLVYYKIKNNEKALEYYERSLAVKEEINYLFDLDLLLINIGVCQIQLGNYEKAKEFVNRAFAVCKENCSSEIFVIGFNALGMADFKLNQFAEAKINFEKSLKLSEKFENKRYQAENYIYLARIALYDNSLNEAKNYVEKAEVLTREIQYVDIRLDVLKSFAEYYLTLKDYEQASKYQSFYLKIKDSVYTDQLIKNLATVQTNYEERENLKTIRDKDAVLELKEDLIKRQRAQYVFAIVIAILVFGLAGVLYWANNRQRQSNKDLAIAKNKIEEINRELEQKNINLDLQVQARTEELFLLNRSLQQVNSELDNFIYKTSHDIRGPLATLKGMSNLAIMEIRDPVALDYMKKIDTTAERLTTILTRLLIINQINYSSLNPVPVDFKFLVEDIINLERKKGLPETMVIQSDIEPGTILISDQNLFRIVLENLIDNAVKFYNDSLMITPFVKISIGKEPGFVTLKVVDNGIGINQKDKTKVFQMFTRASERSQTGGVGLYLSKLATEKLGGKITLEETSERGSTFFARFPDDLNVIIARREEEEHALEIQRATKAQESVSKTASLS